MATSRPSALQRAFANRDLMRGPARWALVWSVLSAFLFALMALHLGLLIGLLCERGRLDLRLSTDAERQQFERVTGLSFPVVVAAVPIAPPAEPPVPPDPAAPPEGTADGPAGTTAEATTTPLPAPPPAEADVPPRFVNTFYDHGILPSVWRSRDRWWGPALSAAYRGIPFLQANVTSLIVLLFGLIVSLLLRLICLSQLRGNCRAAALQVATSLRRSIYRQAMRIGPEDIDGRVVDQGRDLFVSRVVQLQRAVAEWLYRVIRLPVELVAVLIVAASIDLLTTFQWVCPMVLSAYLWRQSQVRADELFDRTQDKLLTEMSSVVALLGYPRLIRGYGMEQTAHEQFQAQLTRYTRHERAELRSVNDLLLSRMFLILSFITLATLLLFVLGVKILGGNEDFSVPAAAVFLSAFGLGIPSARALWEVAQIQAAGNLAADAIYRYLDRTPSVSQAVGAKFLQPLSRVLHLEQLTVESANRTKLLDRLDLTLAAGKVYSFVSLQPESARALAHLLPRFLEPKSGRILFDGEDVAWVTLESLRAEVIYVSGDDPPLLGTVIENLRAGNPDYTLQQVTDAAKETRAHNFISRLPQGYETLLNGEGESLDIGQRFRLALARAILRNPAVLIIEEPHIPLDEDTKQLLDDAYNRIAAGRTLIFLPGRLSTVRRSDQVVFLHEGRVAALGSQARLVAESPLYRHWEYLNFNEFRYLGETNGRA